MDMINTDISKFIGTSLIFIVITFITYFLRTKILSKSNKKTIQKHNLHYRYIKTDEQLKKIILKTNIESIKEIALDTEYCRGEEYFGKLCLIQMSFYVNSILYTYLLDVIVLSNTILEPFLKNILENENIIKIIHSANNDKEWLYEEFKLITNPIYDTQYAHQFVSKSSTKIGLDVLLNDYLNIYISKEEKKMFQILNWKNRPLTKEMLNYAAFDTIYLIQLRQEIDKKKVFHISDFPFNSKNDFIISKKERNEQKALGFFLGNITKHNESLEDLKKLFVSIYQIVDEEARLKNVYRETFFSKRLIFKLTLKQPDNKAVFLNMIKDKAVVSNELMDKILAKIRNFKLDCKNLVDMNESFDNTVEHTVYNLNNKKLTEKKIKSFSCKAPIYEHCKMLSPTNEHLCFCDNKKMNWYISKGLAEKINENVFRLLFKPNSTGCTDEDNLQSEFYITTKNNCCVICGYEENFMRFHVVPMIYRQFFPNELKAHKSHDVLLLCFICHEKANKVYDIKKKQLAEKYDISLYPQTKYKDTTRNLNKLINIIDNLIKNKSKLLPEREESLRKDIVKFINKELNNDELAVFFDYLFEEKPIEINENSISDQFLLKIKKFNISNLLHNENKKNVHGQKVVKEIYKEQGNYEEFIKEWRIYFIEALKPEYLPKQWRIEHSVTRTFGEYSTFKQN